MKLGHFVMTQECARAALGLPPDAVILRIEVGPTSAVEIMVHSDTFPDLPENTVPMRQRVEATHTAADHVDACFCACHDCGGPWCDDCEKGSLIGRRSVQAGKRAL